MNWEEAVELIINNIYHGLQLNPGLAYGRPITEVPPYPCYHYGYGGVPGFKVRIGEYNFIEIPIEMLRLVFENAIDNHDGIYNGQVFGEIYPHQLHNHGCHVHTVGKILQLSGIAVYLNSYYQIL